jgi:hypothetical protein
MGISAYNNEAVLAAGAVRLLMGLLQSKAPAEQSAALALCKSACYTAAGQEEVATAGALPLLVGLLQSKWDLLKHSAARILCQLAAGGATQPLLDLLTVQPVGAQGDAAKALGSVIGKLGQAEAAGGISLLVGLLRSQPDVARDGAIEIMDDCLRHNARLPALSTERKTTAVPLPVALPLLVELLESQPAALQAHAAKVLGVIGRDRVAEVVLAGAMPLLVGMLKSESAGSVQCAAALALCRLASGSTQGQMEVVAAGAAPLLVSLLTSHSEPVQEQAAMALEAVMRNDAGNPWQAGMTAVTVAGAVPLLVGLLQSPSAAVQEGAARALHAVGQSNPYEVLSAGGIQALVRLLHNWSEAVRDIAASALAVVAAGSEGGQALEDLISALELLPAQAQAYAAKLVAQATTQPKLLRDIVGDKAQALKAYAPQLLVRMLQSSSPGVRHTAALEIRAVAAGSEGGRAGAVAAGAEAQLRKQLSWWRPKLRLDARQALEALSKAASASHHGQSSSS